MKYVVVLQWTRKFKWRRASSYFYPEGWNLSSSWLNLVKLNVISFDDLWKPITDSNVIDYNHEWN